MKMGKEKGLGMDPSLRTSGRGRFYPMRYEYLLIPFIFLPFRWLDFYRALGRHKRLMEVSETEVEDMVDGLIWGGLLLFQR